MNTPGYATPNFIADVEESLNEKSLPADMQGWRAPPPVVMRDDSEPYRFPFHADYIDKFLDRHIPAWWGGATCDEVLIFCVCMYHPSDGSGIPGLDDRELRRQLAIAVSRMKNTATSTTWLRTYTARLVAEDRAREAEDECAG